jgi:hypothetical protein
MKTAGNGYRSAAASANASSSSTNNFRLAEGQNLGMKDCGLCLPHPTHPPESMDFDLQPQLNCTY